MRTPVTRTFTLAAVVLAMTAAGCTDDDPAVPRSTRDALATPRVFAVSTTDSTASLHAELDRGSTTVSADVSLAVTGGGFTVGVDGPLLEVDGLAVAVGEIALPVEIFPTPLTLTGVHVHLAAPLALVASWDADDEIATMSGRGGLRLDWSLRVDGVVYPLGSQTMEDLAFAVAVWRDDGQLRLDMNVAARGVMWTWADIIALGDLDVHLTGRAPAP
jgi:hypothetical protein